MKTSRTLSTIITVIQFVGVAVFLLGIHTMIGVFSTALPSDQQEILPRMGDPVVIPFTFTPRNEGFLDADLMISISLVGEENQVLATDQATVTISAGSTKVVELELRVSADEFQQHMMDPDQVTLVTSIRIATFFDLIRFSNTMTTTGGA